jgi:GxxExxY protein
MKFKTSRKVIGCAMSVHRTLGSGFLENVYENAFAIELEMNGISFQRQVRQLVLYREKVVGSFRVDVIIENKLLVELKALNSIDTTCESQLLNYLKASNIDVGLLINFGSASLQFKRMTIAC